MTTAKNHYELSSLDIALVAMPWPLFNRPSVQLGALKAYLEREEPRFSVQAFHPYLEVARVLGLDIYSWISRNVWVSEALYAALLFPSQRKEAGKIVAEALRRTKNSHCFDFDAAIDALRRQVEDWLQGHDWQRFGLVGFSVCFNQLFSSLFAAKLLKEIHPHIPVVFGGSTCAPDVGRALLAKFSQIDYVISGEGERPLLALCRLLAGDEAELPREIQTAGENSAEQIESTPTGKAQLADVNELPTPDYRHYFNEMGLLFKDSPFIPELPVEFSRGCWWRKCTFCNLNLQWCGYRSKKAEQMVQQVESLSRTYGCLDFCFTDNALPVCDSVIFFQKIAARKKDYRFFGEVRVTQRGEQLVALRKGGLRSIQAGIESFSNSLLIRMRKGVTVMDNIAMMKDSLDCGVVLDGNLIIEFPGSTESEVEETLKNLDFVIPFPPLVTAAFFLGHGSPVACDPKAYGIRAVLSHPQYARLIPSEMLSGLTLLIKGYRGDRAIQRGLWQPVSEKVSNWRKFHTSRKGSAMNRPPLSFRDGGGYIVIRQELPDKKTLHHRLRGASREIYLYCGTIRTFSEIQSRFSAVSAEALESFLEDLVRKRLLFREGEKCLALAVHRP